MAKALTRRRFPWLFDLDADPGEQNNLLTERPETTRRLKQLFQEWEREVQHSR